MAYISEHISWREATFSKTANKKEIDNTPSQNVVVQMKKTAKMIFEPLRKWANEPIRVNSFYRSPELCDVLSGSKRTSQHTKGEAIDIDAMGEKTNSDLFHYIKENLNFDQLIWEHGDDENPDWIHVSYKNEESNRNRILVAYKEKKRTKYKEYV